MDCDSSCIFTAIQSAYEKLMVSAPAETQRDHSKQNGGNSDGRNEASSYDATQRGKTGKSRTTEPTTLGRTNSNARSGDVSHSQSNKSTKSDKYEASRLSTLSTEQLRSILRKFQVIY